MGKDCFRECKERLREILGNSSGLEEVLAAVDKCEKDLFHKKKHPNTYFRYDCKKLGCFKAQLPDFHIMFGNDSIGRDCCLSDIDCCVGHNGHFMFIETKHPGKFVNGYKPDAAQRKLFEDLVELGQGRISTMEICLNEPNCSDLEWVWVAGLDRYNTKARKKCDVSYVKEIMKYFWDKTL